MQVNEVPGKSAPRPVLETSRLILREMTVDDAPFILDLLNQPSFLQFVGDKGLRTVADAAQYIEDGPRATYHRHGYGLYLVLRKETGHPMGICGLVSRDWLDAPDLGFSLLPPYWSLGYAFEAAVAVLDHAEAVHRISRVLAITNPGNQSSIRLLRKLGFSYRNNVNPPGRNEELALWIRNSPP